MTTYELFTFLFSELDVQWEKCRDSDLGHFLSEMNPYLYEEEGSADPAIYEDFKIFFQNKKIEFDYGFKSIQDYLDSITFYPNLKRFICKITREEWIKRAEKFLETQ